MKDRIKDLSLGALIILTILVGILSILLDGYLLMIAVGVLFENKIIPATLGYWSSVFVSLLLTTVLRKRNNTNPNKLK